MKDKALIPEQRKYRLVIESGEFDMVSDDFDVILRRGGYEKTLRKSDLIYKVETIDGKEVHSFYFKVDTEEFGPGDLICIVMAYVPDTDFTGGTRTEVDRFIVTNVEKA